MATPKPKATTRANADHHTKAAECCTKAAEEHLDFFWSRAIVGVPSFRA